MVVTTNTVPSSNSIMNTTTTTNNNKQTNNNNSNNNNNNKKRKYSVDMIFQRGGKNIQIGQSYRVPLYKGPSVINTGDPVDLKAPSTTFPLLAKFPTSSVSRPDFINHPWHTARLYQQDIPKPPVTESDEEDDDDTDKKKRWKYYTNKQQQDQQQAPRQWVLQEEVDFLETMVSRREKKVTAKQGQGQGGTGDGKDATTTGDNPSNTNGISTRYEGIMETVASSTSRYALIRVDRTTGKLIVQLVPDNGGTVTFHQPSLRKALSLSQAEQFLQDQSAGIRSSITLDRTDYDKIKHDQLHGGDSTSNNSASKKPLLGIFRNPRTTGLNNTNTTKGRLFQKLKEISTRDDPNVDDADDVMADVAFRNRKGAAGGGGAARRELLASLGDGLAVTDDGVIGGSNDAAFGGRQKFGKLQQPDSTSGGGGGAGGGNEDGGTMEDEFGGANNNNAFGSGGGSGTEERGADGAAMSDDFYTRDVMAEYEELDYDANEQFDDDDVDVGEGDIVMDNDTNFGAEDDNTDSDSDDEDDTDDNATISGAEGLASVAGFKALLAKARGEAILAPQQQQQQQQQIGGSGTDGTSGAAGIAANGDGTNTGPDSKGLDPKNTVANTTNPGGVSSAADAAKKKMMQQNNSNKKKSTAKDDSENDHFAKIVAAAELANQKATQKKQLGGGGLGGAVDTTTRNDAASSPGQTITTTPATAVATVPTPAAASSGTAGGSGGGIQLDENGLRVITLPAVQKEIWLNHGSVTTKRLMKLFDIHKKSSELRQKQFRDIVKELCTMKTDPIKGRMLVLKQHYSNMG